MRTIDELAAELKGACERPRSGGKLTEIHLFGIRHAQALRSVSIPAVLDKAGLGASYRTEINKGINLAPFVNLR